MNVLSKCVLKARSEGRFYLVKWGLLSEPEGVISKRQIIKYLPRDPVIVDAGAYIGSDSVEFSRYLPNAIVFAFEPVPDVFRQLCHHARKYPNIRCRHHALGSRTGETAMFVSGSGGCQAASSLLKPTQELIERHRLTFDQSISVKVFTLDDWAAQEGVDHVDFLWLDLQGMEKPVLEASPRILSRVRAMCLEVSIRKTYEGVADYLTLRDWLKNQGFQVAVEAIPPGTDMGNVLFVRDK